MPTDPNCDHDWKWVHDSVGDADVVNGLQHFSYRECRICGEEDHETKYEPEYFDDDVL